MRTVTKILAAMGLVSALGFWKHQKGRRPGVTPRQHVARCIDEEAALSDNEAWFVGSTDEGRMAS